MCPEQCPADGRHCQYADEAAERAVKKTFSILGVDVDHPGDVEKFRQDLRFGGRLRRFADKGAMAFWLSVVGLAASAIIFKLFGKLP